MQCPRGGHGCGTLGGAEVKVPGVEVKELSGCSHLIKWISHVHGLEPSILLRYFSYLKTTNVHHQ